MRLVRPSLRSLAQALLTVLATIGVALATAPTAHPSPAALPGAEDGVDAPGGRVRVELTGIAPTVLEPDDDLTVTGVLHNESDAELAVPRLQLRIQQQVPISRSALERWLDPTSWSATRPLDVHELDDELAPGGSVGFRIVVDTDDLALGGGPGGWGPRGIEVSAWDGPRLVAEQYPARSYALWWPDLDIEQMPVTVLGALVPTAAERSDAQRDGVALAAAADARLRPLLAVLDRPGMDVVLDPALLHDPVDLRLRSEDPSSTATAQPGQPDGAEDPAGPPEPVGEAVTRFVAAGDRALHVLPWADADVAALAHAGRADLLRDALERSREELDTHDILAAPLTQPGRAATLGLRWPVGPEPDLTTLETLAAHGGEAAVLSGSALPTADVQTYTAAGRAAVELPGGELDVLLSDDRLSEMLTGTHQPVDATAPAVALDTLTARQLLLSETAVIARERPADPRAILLTVPRGFDGDPQLLATTLDALERAPWLERASVSEMLAEPVSDLDRETLPERLTSRDEVTASTLTAAEDAVTRARGFASMLAEPGVLVDAVRTEALGVASAAWREDAAGRGALLRDLAAAGDARDGLVAAQPGSTLNLINNEAHIPVSVTNDLAQPVDLAVRLEPRNPRLVAEEEVAVTIAPRESAIAQVPVHAVGSGDVDVDVVLTSPSGERVGTESQMRVRVRADWETVGTAVVAGLLVVLLVLGLVRTVRRGRRMPPQQVDA